MFTVPAEHQISMTREIGLGIPKAESTTANIDEQHTLFWDQTAAVMKGMGQDGSPAPDLPFEVPEPLMNEEFRDLTTDRTDPPVFPDPGQPVGAEPAPEEA